MIAFYHRQVTQEALDHRVSQAALETIIAANLGQDSLSGLVGHPEFHFDDNAFTAGQSYLEQQRGFAISAIKNNNDSLAAWKAFGQLTHCVQDFYAHSNYVSLWLNLHQGLEAVGIDPLDTDILTLPTLRSGHIYYPWELLTFLPVIGKIFRYLLPRNAHAWMNLDSPASGPLFDYARHAAVKRTGIEFDLVSSQLLDCGGTGFVSLFTGLTKPVN